MLTGRLKSASFDGKSLIKLSSDGCGELSPNETNQIPTMGTDTAVASPKNDQSMACLKLILLLVRQVGLTDGLGCSLSVNFSFQRIFPVACITTNKVMIEPIVIAKPVKPFRKNA
jgi:hypothetical protein